MKLVAVALAAVLLASSPVAAQSRVTDIYAAMAANAARHAEEQAAIRNRMIRELFDLPVAILEQRPVERQPVRPVVATPASSATMQKYLEEALAYQKEQDTNRANRAMFAALFATIGSSTPAPVSGTADCGVKPVKPVPPVGCRDLVAQCVVDGSGRPSWQWVCVK